MQRPGANPPHRSTSPLTIPSDGETEVVVVVLDVLVLVALVDVVVVDSAAPELHPASNPMVIRTTTATARCTVVITHAARSESRTVLATNPLPASPMETTTGVARPGTATFRMSIE
jgi:hypothetical protein